MTGMAPAIPEGGQLKDAAPGGGCGGLCITSSIGGAPKGCGKRNEGKNSGRKNDGLKKGGKWNGAE